MKVSGFTASADIVGRRVRVSWDFVPENAETIADVPPVTLRRKLRDFVFPPPIATDPFLVYDSISFPPTPVPGAITVTDLPSWEAKESGTNTIYQPVSVATSVDGRMVEVLRRTMGTTYDANGVPVRQHVEILDTGAQPGGLDPNTSYYYQLFSRNLPADGDGVDPYRGATMVTDTYGLNRTLYESLPEIYRRHDVATRPLTPGTDTVPEEAPRFGQLRRFTDLFGVALDSIRGTAEGLRGLHDVDRVDARFLPLIAQWIAWEFSIDSEIPVRRNELKTAPQLYRLVGTLPGLRALVSQYTGWFTQVAEFAQNLALSNRGPQKNVFAITPATGGAVWRGVDDVADLLGFGAGNQGSVGSGALPATLTGTVAEPFPLRPGMTMTVAVDGLLPQTVRFGLLDFQDITQATAAEVAAAIDGALSDVHAASQAGRVVLASDSVGDQSELQITPEPASLISLENAPLGRLSPVVDSQSHIRAFYEVWETPTQRAGQALAAGVPDASVTGNYVLRRVHYKTFSDGAWRNSHPVFESRPVPQGDTAALVLADDRIFAAWVDNPQTASSGMRYAIGSSRPMLPARLLGQLREPFVLKDGAVLALVGNWPGVDRYTVHAGDFANLTAAKAAEVVAAMNAQLTRSAAALESNGAIRLETKSGGVQARIAVDLMHSTAARALGFTDRNAVGTPGSWSEEIDWSPALDVISIPDGRHQEIAALNDPAGGVRLAWSSHRAGQWRIYSARWSRQIFVATQNGLFLGSGVTWTPIAGLPSADVRSLAADSDGTLWIGTAAGAVLRRANGTLVALAPPLPSADVRAVRLGADGTAWFATAAGVSSRAPGGALTNLTGLPSNDVRSLALTPNGSVWIATASGLAVRRPNGALDIFQSSVGVPSNDIRDVTVESDGTAYAATAAGVAVTADGGASFTIFAAASDLGSADTRALALGRNQELWVATAHGVSRRLAKSWTIFDTGGGLPSDDARTVSLAPDGSAWVGTAGGVSTISPDGVVSNLDLVGGGAGTPPAQSIHTGWSSPAELAGANASNREPVLALDATNRTWLIWSAMIGVGPQESWGLHYRIFDPVAGTWGAETNLTAPPAVGRSSDRTPAAIAIPGGMRIFFSSDRAGGFALWSVDVTLAGVVSPLVSITNEPSSESAPAPLSVGGALWLLYRSDRNVSLAQTGSSYPPHSLRVPDNGAVRRYAGSITTGSGNLARNETRRLFGDLLCYTPNRPDGGKLSDDELYTRGTVGLYVSRANRGSALTQQEAGRLRSFLAQFLPVNLRAIVIVVAPLDQEFVYPAGADIQERYSDQYPFAETLEPLTDRAAAAMPGLVVLESNKLSDVSANPADLTTLRRRTFFPPFQ